MTDKKFKTIMSETKKMCPSCYDILDLLENEATEETKGMLCELCGNMIKRIKKDDK